jgi:hypothetical protein
MNRTKVSNGALVKAPLEERNSKRATGERTRKLSPHETCCETLLTHTSSDAQSSRTAPVTREPMVVNSPHNAANMHEQMKIIDCSTLQQNCHTNGSNHLLIAAHCSKLVTVTVANIYSHKCNNNCNKASLGFCQKAH